MFTAAAWQATEPDSGRGRLPRRVLVPVMAAFTMLVAVSIWGQFGSGTGTGLLVLDCCCGVAALALIPWMYRNPPPGALLLAVLASVSPAVTPPSTFATLTVAQRRPLGLAVLVGAAGVLAHAIRGWWRPPGGLSFGWWITLDVVAHAALIGIGALLQAHNALVRSLLDRAAAAEAEQGRLVAEARAAERTQMAREMHDVLAHRLSLLATHAGALEYRPDAPPDRIAAAAGVVRAGVHDALEDLRQVIRVLRDDTDTESDPTGRGARVRRPQPVLADVEVLADESRAAGARINVIDDVDQRQPPPPTVGRTGYRIVQEAITNARKHAAGRPVTVQLTGSPGAGLTIIVSNPLAAAGETEETTAAVPGSGTGLVGLTERARLAGGRLDHQVTARSEFRLSAWLPWPE